LATSTAQHWDRLKPNLERGADLIKSRDLPDKSFNAIIVILTWYQIIVERLDSLPGLSCTERDDLEEPVGRRAQPFVARWCSASGRAGVWAESAGSTFQNFAADVSTIHNSLESCSAASFLEIVDRGIAKVMDRIVPKAIQHIDNLVVR